MKILKYLFFLLLIVLIGGAIYVATLDGDYQVEETMLIEAPRELLFNEVNEYKTWENWGPWKEEDPNMVVTYADTTSGEGASYSWEGDESMDGKMKTTEVIPPKSITQQITFDTPFGESKSTVYWNFEEKEKGTLVTWGMKGEQSFMEKAYQATQDSTMAQMIQPMFTKGLQNLSEVVKKKMEVYDINVDGITQHSGGYYMYNTTASRFTPEALRNKMSQMLPQVYNYMETNNLQISGSPFTLYNTIDEENGTVIISAAIPTPNKVTPAGGENTVLCGFLESQKVVKATLKGDYKNLSETWAKLESFIQQNENIVRKPNAKPFEVYVTQPSETKNPANWVTEIYIPVQDADNTENIIPVKPIY
ncbi:SRPBCC family protein [Mesonia maritima]|uniref:Effector-binding domain-containing protein n=1 Tax=Mesonia maritima TaxID=1793873 RepID=A0ABU1K4P3_9FLAO|nr:GyrI-like domain-containing protein [Mesonia maritima]MDR6300584.1 effector-binding domain-containing protein [Mesonia maritima]